MNVRPTVLPGVLLIEPKVHRDQRGFFLEDYHLARYREMGIERPFVQDNHSRSQGSVLRGLHYQRRHPQGKLLRVVRGSVFDVAADIRRGSPTFGRWCAAVLSESNHRQLYVPPGLAHGFVVLSERADVLYKCTDYYDPGDPAGIAWDDPDLAIAWPVSRPLLSEKDRALPYLRTVPRNALPRFAAVGPRGAAELGAEGISRW